MTQNEANMSIKHAVCVLEAIGNGLTLRNENDREGACVLAIKAINELLQYRAIGTVEQLRTMFDGYWKLKDLCEEYEKYGLPEDYWKLNEMCKEYSAIGTIEEFKALKEKSVAKKPRFYAHNYYCTECGNLVGNNEFEWQRFLYCDKCGQKLDLS